MRYATIAILAALLSGCTGGGSAAAHREDTTVRTLVHKEDSFDSIYGTLTARGYQCSDEAMLNGGRIVVCGKHFGHIVCGWEVHVVRVKSPELDNFGISVIQGQPLLGSQC